MKEEEEEEEEEVVVVVVEEEEEEEEVVVVEEDNARQPHVAQQTIWDKPPHQRCKSFFRFQRSKTQGSAS